ncbi:MAG: hypothetical protein ACK2T3_06915, partial [Candidatus Promineifilaceae bacterium]
QPLLIVILDGLDGLLVGKDRFLHRKFGLLLNGGPEVGFRFLLSLENPLAKEVRPLHRHQYGLRLAGKAIDENWAWAAAGMTRSGAHLLDGRGDFIAATGGESLRFQSAYIGKAEMNKMARQLRIQKGRSLLAQPAADNLPVFSPPARQSTNRKQHHVERKPSANTQAASEEGVDSGAGDWLTADWEDRFWMDRN